MKILAYDTSSDVLSAALFDGPKRLAQSGTPLFTRHSDGLVPAIEKLLKKAHCNLNALECIAVGLGPGSFTGLRVGITTAKFLSYATGAKLVGVPSLEVIACQAKSSGKNVAVMRDAKKGKVYAAIYRIDPAGVPRTVSKPQLTQEKDFLERLRTPYVLIEKDVFPNATDLARIARGLIRQKKYEDPRRLVPLYLHPRDCNVTQQKTHGR